MTRFARALGPLLAIPLALSACAFAPGGSTNPVPTTIRTEPVALGTISGTIVLSGNVASRDKISIVPKVAGQIAALAVDVGSTVKQGDVIAELDHATLDAQVSQAQAGLEVAQAKLATIRAGSRPETIAQAKANLAAAQATLDFLKSG